MESCTSKFRERSAKDLVGIHEIEPVIGDDTGPCSRIVLLTFHQQGSPTYPIEQQPIWKPIQ